MSQSNFRSMFTKESVRNGLNFMQNKCAIKCYSDVSLSEKRINDLIKCKYM